MGGREGGEKGSSLTWTKGVCASDRVRSYLTPQK